MNQPSTLLEQPREVDVVSIERELTQLWKRASEPVGGEAAPPVVRACSLNLIVVTDRGGIPEELSTIIGEATLDHPARIFQVDLDKRSGAASLDAWISARCSVPVPGGKQVCSEEITLTARGADRYKVPNIVTSLLVPDVPVVMLWKATLHQHDEAFAALMHLADTVFIDSSDCEDPQGLFASWSALLAASDGRPAFGDLAWVHAHAWRETLGHAVQPPELRQYLSSVTSITIGYSVSPEPYHSGLGQAFLLAGWIAGRLSWKSKSTLRETSGGRFEADLASRDEDISLVINPVSSEHGRHGGIESVAMQVSTDARISCDTIEQPDCVRITVSLPGGTSREEITVLCDRDESQIIGHALERLHRDESYENALTTFRTIVKGGA